MESLNRHEDYGQESLDETHLLTDPIAQFKLWLAEAEAAEIYEPNAFVLGTVDEQNQSRSRTVLLKGVDERGFFFATNYLSRKGEAVAAVSEAGMVKTKKTKAIGGDAVAGVAEAGLKAKTAGKKAGGEGEW